MILTKNTPLELFSDGEPIHIDKEVSLDSKLLELLFVKFPHSKISITTFTTDSCSSIENDVLYNEEELAILVQNAEIADRYGRELTFDDNYSLEQAIISSRKLNDHADFINNFKLNGKSLSPLEKFMLAYSIVTNKVYTDDKENTHNPRNIISTLSGDKIVCAGYANELAALCQRIGIPCAYRTNSVKTKNGFENHATCIINLKDNKYKIDGLFIADPTGDAKRPNLENSPFNFSFNYFLVTEKEYLTAQPTSKFDQAVLDTEGPIPEFINAQIQNINSLYPNVEPDTFLSQEFFNQTTHSLDTEKVKSQLKENIIKTFPKNLSNEPKGQCFIYQGLLEESIVFHLINTFSNEKNNQLPPLVSNYYEAMNQTSSSDEILNALLALADKVSSEDILTNYQELLEGDKKRNRYTNYMELFFKDIERTKPIPDKTLYSLLKTMLPSITNLNRRQLRDYIDYLLDTRAYCLAPQNLELS